MPPFFEVRPSAARRPFLRDPDDDTVLECAVAAGCAHIVTHNIKDFRGTEQLGVKAVTPAQFCKF